ncbi:hypothetical protein WJX84_009196, partial [Apatococcus fuscideae]
PSVLGRAPLRLVVDSGTGITATGLGLGIKLLQLPWSVTAVSLVETPEQCLKVQHWLTQAFADQHCEGVCQGLEELPIEWVPRLQPRRFGKVLEGEIAACRQVAQQCGILVDPIYNLAAWAQALHLACQSHATADEPGMTEAGLITATSFAPTSAVEPVAGKQSWESERYWKCQSSAETLQEHADEYLGRRR